MRDLQDLVHYEPGVAATGDPNRAGLTGLNIRGLQDNRVLTLVDGVRVPNFFSFGIAGFDTATGNLVDVDSLKRIEILRGPRPRFTAPMRSAASSRSSPSISMPHAWPTASASSPW